MCIKYRELTLIINCLLSLSIYGRKLLIKHKHLYTQIVLFKIHGHDIRHENWNKPLLFIDLIY